MLNSSKMPFLPRDLGVADPSRTTMNLGASLRDSIVVQFLLSGCSVRQPYRLPFRSIHPMEVNNSSFMMMCQRHQCAMAGTATKEDAKGSSSRAVLCILHTSLGKILSFRLRTCSKKDKARAQAASKSLANNCQFTRAWIL